MYNSFMDSQSIASIYCCCSFGKRNVADEVDVKWMVEVGTLVLLQPAPVPLDGDQPRSLAKFIILTCYCFV